MHMIFSEIMKLDLDAKTKFQVVEVLLGLILKGASYEQIQK